MTTSSMDSMSDNVYSLKSNVVYKAKQDRTSTQSGKSSKSGRLAVSRSKKTCAAQGFGAHSCQLELSRRRPLEQTVDVLDSSLKARFEGFVGGG